MSSRVLKDREGDIRPGDQVLAADHLNPEEKPAAANVVRFFDNGEKDVVKLIFSGREAQTDAEPEEIVCTPEHPFYVIDRGWICAKDLQLGDFCLSANGERIAFVSRGNLSEKRRVYNFEVEKLHSFFVYIGRKNFILTHNLCFDPLLEPEPDYDNFDALSNLGCNDIWSMHRALNPKRVIRQEIRKNNQIVNDIHNTGKAGIFIASFVVPGPDDVVWVALSSKYGIRLVGKTAEKLLSRNGKLLTGRELEDTVELIYKIRRQSLSSAEDVDDLADYIRHLDYSRLPKKFNGNVTSYVGHEFEKFLQYVLGGIGPFKVGGREFDGAFGSRWYEAKSGNYWKTQSTEKFQSDICHHLKIAEANGATLEVFSNTPIPKKVKKWLSQKKIKFTEFLE